MHKIDAEKFIKERLSGVPPQIEFIDQIHSKHDFPSLNFYCAGGAIRDIFDGNLGSFSDIDLFPREQKDYDNLIALLRDKFNATEEKENDFNTSFNVQFKIEKKNDNGEELEEVFEFIVQVVKFYHSSVEDLLDKFDFTICQFLYSGRNDEFVLGENSLLDLKNKKLVINKITYPLSTMRRFFKYTNKGFYACSGCLKTFIMHVRQEEGGDLDKEPEYID